MRVACRPLHRRAQPFVEIGMLSERGDMRPISATGGLVGEPT
jgi:hypothetical protein